MQVALLGARDDVEAEVAAGYLVYRAAHESGSDVIRRVEPEGTEDYVVFERAPADESVGYRIELGGDVAGLRLVANTLELASWQCGEFSRWYNNDHHHEGLRLFTPADVFFGRVDVVASRRQQALYLAFVSHP